MRQSCLDAFNSYVARYDALDERIALKVEHTYEVAELCDEIARGEGLPSDLSAREHLFCTITRDADKVDILRVFNQSSCEAVLGIDSSDFLRGEISDVAFGAFGERRCLSRDERPGSLDGLVGAVCLAFELELPASRKALGDRGYLQALLREPFGLSPLFESELTQYRWDAICDVMGRFHVC